MKLRILRNPGWNSGFPRYAEGQLIDCEPNEAEQLLAGLLAEIVPEAVKIQTAFPTPLEEPTETKKPKKGKNV